MERCDTADCEGKAKYKVSITDMEGTVLDRLQLCEDCTSHIAVYGIDTDAITLELAWKIAR